MKWILYFNTLLLLLSGCVSLPSSSPGPTRPTSGETTTTTHPTTTSEVIAAVETDPRTIANLAALLFLASSGLIIVGVAAVTKTLPWNAALIALASGSIIALLPEVVDLTSITLKSAVLGAAIGGLAFSAWRVYNQYRAERAPTSHNE